MIVHSPEYIQETTYWGLMTFLITDRAEKHFPSSSKKKHLARLLGAFKWKSAPLIFRGLQKIIDSIVSELPLVGTPMQSWAMCNRIQILDPSFEDLTPKEALAYQKNLNSRMFPLTSLGLSDSNMTKNHLLKIDVRKTVPFGLFHHNPMRNLYQTLGMKGDETPQIMSESEKILEEKNVVRKGWNLVTAFIDLPDNFEDQIIVSERLKDKFIVEKRSFTCHGLLFVQEGDSLDFLDNISLEPDGTLIKFNTFADSAEVEEVRKIRVSFNGTKKEARLVVVKMKKIFKDGFKLINRAGNKGIIYMTDTGYMNDPIRGRIPIDVIASAKSIEKRRNFGQLFEALASLTNGPEKKLVVRNDYLAHIDKVKESLTKKGYNVDGTVNISTQWGSFKAVCGWVFWGCIKTPEDQIWTGFDTNITSNKGVRLAGNKISHIELKALLTIFGPNNPIITEVMSYRQGLNQVFDVLEILRGMKNKFPENLPTLAWDQVRQVDQSEGFFHKPADFSGTVADTDFHPRGFIMKLPSEIKYVLRIIDGVITEDLEENTEVQEDETTLVLDRILIPPSDMRKPWKHSTGKLGMTDLASLANNVVKAIYRYKSGEEQVSRVGRALYQYFHGLGRIVSTKRGTLSRYAMSIRYPLTAKAVAVVISNLDENEIEIHEIMAQQLKVKDGDIVLVERFPCLGFMSIRAQKVRVTDDAQAKFVIRVSGNSLASLTLDFDGDVLYIMSFHGLESKLALKEEFKNPHPARLKAYEVAKEKKVPVTKEMSLDDFNMEVFPPLTAEKNASIVEGLTGIKRGTGTVIALCYNLMRIIEGEIGFDNTKMSIAMELLLDKIANSVFSRKHAGRSLEEECRQAVCTANVEKMIELEFNEEASKALCTIIRKLAPLVGINPNNLERYYEWAERKGRSSVVNKIVRRNHKIWFTSRSNLHPIDILDNLKASPSDLTGYLFQKAKKAWDKANETPILERALG